MEQYLNPLEIKALEELKKIEGDNGWTISIRMVVSANEPSKFRQLIADLKSQANDCADVMKRILGNAYDSVITL